MSKEAELDAVEAAATEPAAETGAQATDAEAFQKAVDALGDIPGTDLIDPDTGETLDTGVDEEPPAEGEDAAPEAEAKPEETEDKPETEETEKAEGEPEKAPEDDSVSGGLARVAKAEARSRRKLQAEQEQTTKALEALKTKEQSVQEQYTGLENAAKNFQEDPNGSLEKLGQAFGVDLSFEGITRRYYEGKQAAPPQSNQAMGEIEKLRAELKEERAQQAEQQRKAGLQTQVEQYNNTVVDTIIGDIGKYELTAGMAEESGATVQEIVAQHVQAVFQSTGTFLTAAEACDSLEKTLEKQALRLARTRKVQGHLKVPTTQQPKDAPQATPGNPTLTNDLASQRATNGSADLSDDARLRRAIAKMGDVS